MQFSLVHSKFPLAFFLALASTCLTATLLQTNATSAGSIDLPDANATLGIPDPRFSFRAFYWGPKLRSTSCLMNAVNAMTNMAIPDFSEQLGETVFEMTSQPGVAITVLPKDWERGGEMQRKFAIWGLYLAVYNMGKGDKYQCNTFHLFWKGKEVGTIGFSRGVVGRPQTALSEVNDLKSQGLLPVSKNATLTPSIPKSRNSILGLKAEPVLSLRIKFFATNIPIFDIFVTILGALSDIASFDNLDAPVMAMIFDTRLPTYLSFTTWDKPSESRAPFMTNRHIIEALGYLPDVMFEERKFSEADITIKLDGIESGLGVLRKVLFPRLDRAPDVATV